MQYLIIGGQACILYGGAEFSRDIDFSIMPSSESLEKWRKALADLQAEPIFLPSFEQKYLEKGHGCHFRCHHPEAKGLRVDIIGRMQGCDEFPLLWKRRTVFDLPGTGKVNVISLPDLVQSKKTQRDKDWPMIRRLIEVDYLARKSSASQKGFLWWLKECRTPIYLKKIVKDFPNLRHKVVERPWLKNILNYTDEEVGTILDEERKGFIIIDREYWDPLRKELERMRHGGS